MQFGRRRSETAETHRLRHLRRRLHDACDEGRRNGLEKRRNTLHAHRRHERRMGLCGLRLGQHCLRRGLRTAGRRNRGQSMGKRHAEIHPGQRQCRFLRLFGFRRERQSLHGRKHTDRRSPDGDRLEKRRRAPRLLGQPGRLAGPVGRRLGQRRLRRRQPAKRIHQTARRRLEKRQGALHPHRRGIRSRSNRTLSFGQDDLRRGATALRSGKTRTCFTP